jgi:hypothetical protein
VSCGGQPVGGGGGVMVNTAEDEDRGQQLWLIRRLGAAGDGGGHGEGEIFYDASGACIVNNCIRHVSRKALTAARSVMCLMLGGENLTEIIMYASHNLQVLGGQSNLAAPQDPSHTCSLTSSSHVCTILVNQFTFQFDP